MNSYLFRSSVNHDTFLLNNEEELSPDDVQVDDININSLNG